MNFIREAEKKGKMGQRDDVVGQTTMSEKKRVRKGIKRKSFGHG